MLGSGTADPANPADKVVYSAGNTETLPGKVVRSTGDQPSGDPAVDEACDSTGQVLSTCIADEFGRNSVDGQGGLVTATVHYGDGLRQRLLGRHPARLR